MKAMRKILVTILCLCLVFGCVSISTFAADTATGSITIQNPSHSEATVGGKTFNVYKVFNATASGTSTSYSWYKDANNNIPFYDYFYGPTGVVEANKAGGPDVWIDAIKKDAYNSGASDMKNTLVVPLLMAGVGIGSLGVIGYQKIKKWISDKKEEKLLTEAEAAQAEEFLKKELEEAVEELEDNIKTEIQ